MPTAQLAHVLIFAKDLASQVDFYCRVFGLRALPAQDPGYAVLVRDDRPQLAIHALPSEIADTIEIASPAVWRQEAAMKPCFDTDDLPGHRAAFIDRGGQAKDPWTWQGDTYCDCADPEGNVVQLRQRAATP